MSNIGKLKKVVENLEIAETKIAVSKLPEATKKELFEILQEIAEKPLDGEVIFSKKTSYLLNKSSKNPETIGIEILLNEQKENCESVFSKMLTILSDMKQQLLSMKGAGFFNLEEDITKTKTKWLRKPSKGIIGDYGSSIEEPIKVKYNKVVLSDGMIDQLIQEIDNKIEEAEIFLKSTNNIQINDNVFAVDNIKRIQSKAEEGKNFVGKLYKKINTFFPKDSFQEQILDKELAYDGDLHHKIRDNIQSKNISFYQVNRVLTQIEKPKRDFVYSFLSQLPLKKEQKIEKGSMLIFDLPEIDELLKIQLGTIKEIFNPNYEKTQKYIEELQSIVNSLSIVLSIDNE